MALAINQTTGALSLAASQPVPAFVSGVSTSPDGNLVFVATTSGLYVYAFDRTANTFTEVEGPIHASGSVTHAAASPDGRFLMVAENTASVLTVFEIGTDGTLTEVPDGVADVGAAPNFVLAVAPDAAP